MLPCLANAYCTKKHQQLINSSATIMVAFKDVAKLQHRNVLTCPCTFLRKLLHCCIVALYLFYLELVVHCGAHVKLQEYWQSILCTEMDSNLHEVSLTLTWALCLNIIAYLLNLTYVKNFGKTFASFETNIARIANAVQVTL